MRKGAKMRSNVNICIEIVYSVNCTYTVHKSISIILFSHSSILKSRVFIGKGN